MPVALIAIFGAYQILLFLIHADIYQGIVTAFGWQSAWLPWLFGFLSITFVSSSLIAFRSHNVLAKWYYRASAYWFGLVQFLFGGVILFLLLENLFYGMGYYVSPAILGGASFLFALLLHSYATWQTVNPKLTRVTTSLPNLPAFWRNKKIVFVSDLHLGAVRGKRLAQKAAALITAESPEIVLIGGDMFDGVKCPAGSLIEPFKKLKPPHGIYFITGNHEYMGDIATFLKEIEHIGIHILHNETITIQGLQIAGVDWKSTHRNPDFENALKLMAIDREQPSILLRHEPNHPHVARDAGVSMMLSGHTHAGQIFPLGYLTKRIYKGLDYGLQKYNDMMVYTSSGVGTWGPPLRFGTKAEVAVITLK